ncbi:MAG: extracellular solute-binding protein [Clostridia bacterium]|nr:extracellular solute-binding protein [Clostridia bacterium]
MLKKRILACILVAALLLLTSCGSAGRSSGARLMGDTESPDPLRICIDLMDFSTDNPQSCDTSYNDLLFRLKETAGLEDVVLEIIPSPYDFKTFMADTTPRATAIDRIRSEIMAGEGPDVFLMTYMTYLGTMGPEYDSTDCLFKYPQKAMENGIFLPLDEYIENSAELGEWDKLIKPVLDAGRNDEGQLIVPLNYSFPLLCYPKSEWEHIPDKKYTWNDMLTNPELLPVSLDMANCGYSDNILYMSGPDSSDTSWETEFFWQPYYLPFIMGELADYDAEELSFTEEELLARVKDILALERQDGYMEFDKACEEKTGIRLSDRYLNVPMTFMPLYNADGGITVEIERFAAVNRNTKRPEDAFRVIDLLMSGYVQQWSDFYSEFIYKSNSLPMHEELFQKEHPTWGNNYYMLDENFEAFCKVREQITGANFHSEGTALLSDMMSKCCSGDFDDRPVEEIVHEAYEDLSRRVKE